MGSVIEVMVVGGMGSVAEVIVVVEDGISDRGDHGEDGISDTGTQLFSVCLHMPPVTPLQSWGLHHLFTQRRAPPPSLYWPVS